MDINRNRKTDTMILGAIIGALTGIGAAYLLVKRADRDGDEVSVTTGEGLRLGFLVLGLLRSIATLGDEE